MDPKRGVGVARVFLDLPKLRMGTAGGRVASDSGRAKQRSHALCQVGSTGTVVQDVCTVRTLGAWRSFGCMILLLVDRSMFFISCSFEHGRDDCPLGVHTRIMHRKMSCRVPVMRYVSFGPRPIATRFTHRSTKLVRMQHVFRRAHADR